MQKDNSTMMTNNAIKENEKENNRNEKDAPDSENQKANAKRRMGKREGGIGGNGRNHVTTNECHA